MEIQFKHDWEAELHAPHGGVLKCILVDVEIEPRDGGSLIYGTDVNGAVGFVEVIGSKSNVELPFAHPKIYGTNIKGAKRVTIRTIAWRD